MDKSSVTIGVANGPFKFSDYWMDTNYIVPVIMILAGSLLAIQGFKKIKDKRNNQRDKFSEIILATIPSAQQEKLFLIVGWLRITLGIFFILAGVYVSIMLH